MRRTATSPNHQDGMASLQSSSLEGLWTGRSDPLDVSDVIARRLRDGSRDGSAQYRSGHVFLISAEPGMGKTTILRHVIDGLDSSRDYAKYIDLGRGKSSGVTSRIQKACQAAQIHFPSSGQSVVALDNLPASDESEMHKRARAIRTASRCGCTILVAFLPEAEGIAQELSDASLCRSSDLLIGGSYTSSRYTLEGDVYSYTHGIAQLVRPFATDGHAGGRIDIRPQYLTALSDMVARSLRPTLMEEERRLRLAMLELGKGDISELEGAAGKLDATLISDLSRDAPFFGVNISDGSFCCAGVWDERCLGNLDLDASRLPRGYEAISSNVIRVLTGRGEYARAGILMNALGLQNCRDVVLEHAGEFIDAGCSSIVESALCGAQEAADVNDEAAAEARTALVCVHGDAREYSKLRDGLVVPSLGPTVQAFVELRDFLSGRVSYGIPRECGMCQTHVQRALDAVLTAANLLRCMRYEEAYTYLMGLPERLVSSSASSAILWTEYVVSAYLCGSAPTEEEAAEFDGVLRFSETCGIPLLRLAASTARPFASALVGRSCHEPAVEACVQRFAIAGDRFVQAVCLLAAAISDQRGGAGARAYVRLGQAAEMAGQFREPYLVAITHLLQCAVRSTLGEKVSAEEVLSAEVPDGLIPVSNALAAAIRPARQTRADLLSRVLLSPSPKGAAWLVSVLSHDFGRLSARFRNAVPRLWTDEADRVTRAVEGRLGEPSGHEGEGAKDGRRDGYRLDVSLLGGLRVKVNGVPVSEMRLERRRAKSLLVLLAATQSHEARRYEVMETVWPEFDFHDARQRVYEATSVLRTELTEKMGQSDGKPLVSNRGAGTLGLNLRCLHCDVDDFEDLARQILSKAPRPTREAAAEFEKVEALYRGELYVPVVDGAGLIEQRRNDLRSLYVDVMVAAAEWAIDARRYPTAVHYAQQACNADGLREDAEIALLRAFGCMGRRADAERSYRTFAHEMVRVLHQPPSKELRRAYRDVAEGSERKSMHVEDSSIEEDEGDSPEQA